MKETWIVKHYQSTQKQPQNNLSPKSSRLQKTNLYNMHFLYLFLYTLWLFNIYN